MMRRAVRVAAPARQRRAEVASFPAPIGGLVANRALAMPEDGPQGASILKNWFPTATGAILRRGRQAYAQITDDGSACLSLFKYVVGNNRKLFAASASAIYDISAVSTPYNWAMGEGAGSGDYELAEIPDGYIIGGYSVGPDQLVWDGALGGDWHVVQFATTGGVFLVGVNGASVGFIYDGAAFYPNIADGVWALSYGGGTVDFTAGEIVTGGTSSATATVVEVVPGSNPGEGALLLSGITGTFVNAEALSGSLGGAATSSSDATNVVPGIEFPDGLTTADMAYVWVYKNALWFVQKESLTAWYMPVDQIGGTATAFPLGAEFGHGGYLLIGQSWSMSSSGQGGLSEQNVFVSSEGEVVVYQGSLPSQAASWSKVGTYRIGSPMGRRGFIRAGGDLVFATTIGFVALSTAIQVDQAALAPRSVSFSISDKWAELAGLRAPNWVCMLWPESKMVAIAPPTGDSDPVFLVSNAETGAWSIFTNWDATCMEVYEGGLYFGTPDGFVMQAMVGGTDDGTPFTGIYSPLFTDHGKPTAMKTARMARSELISATTISERLSVLFDFDDTLPAAPDVAPVPIGNEWDNAIWNESVWSAASQSIVTKRRHSVSGYGYRFAPVLQVTSGSSVPLDVQIVSVDMTFEYGDVFT